MGCFNTTGFVSGLNICYEDPVVAIPCIINTDEFSCWYTTTQLVPISLPIFGKYNDYGTLCDIEETPSSIAWKKCVCDNVEKSLKVFERGNVFGYTLLESLKDNGFNEIRGSFDRSLLGNKVTLILEHKSVYEELCGKNLKPYTDRLFSDWFEFNRTLVRYGENPKYLSFSEPLFHISHIDVSNEHYSELYEVGEKYRKKHNYMDDMRSIFWNWKEGFQIYQSNVGKLLDIEGIDRAFTEFNTFDCAIKDLNIGYRVPSCNCGSQENNNKNVIKFYRFLSKFYREELKPREIL